MRKLIFTNHFSFGDVVMVTAAVRDLHQCYPNEFLTDVRTPFPELWEHNPYLTPLNENDPEVEVIDCDVPLIERANIAPYHYVHGYIEFLNEQLKLQIRPSLFKGDLHLSSLEKSWCSQIHELTGEETPFWIVSAGGKYDVTIKWWDHRRFQQVIDHFRGKIQFVQVGQRGHFHPKLESVIDLRGQTDLRQLIRLVYHAEGVLCPVTGLMHLAAAVEMKHGKPAHRACVVVAGGREPVHWEAYPQHQFLHTVGSLRCCAEGGCWRSRTVPLGDGDERDEPGRLCVDVRGNLPHCMDLITPADVIGRIELYIHGGNFHFMAEANREPAERAIAATASNSFDDEPLTIENVRMRLEHVIQVLPPCPANFAGRGIVICAGGVRLFTNAWVCIKMLRRAGCALPIQLWHLGEEELDEQMAALVEELGVECVDAAQIRETNPARILKGWELKPYAILNSPFREVMLIDADNVPVINPEYLFDTEEFRETGAIFWPDYPRREPNAAVWAFCGIPFREEPPFETGQIVVDKERCWRPLALCMWFNENSDFFYRHIYGDKETFHLAFRKLGAPYAMPAKGVETRGPAMGQHDFSGELVFQHRNLDKWNLFQTNKRVDRFLHEEECRGFIEELRQRWDGRMSRFGSLGAGSSSVAIVQEPAKIRACMISCAKRAAVREKTLRALGETDWAGGAVHVQIDAGEFEDPIRRIDQTAFRALRESLNWEVDYVLFLEDDLGFNRNLFHNIQAWAPVKLRRVALASLFNPEIAQLACDWRNHLFIADPRRVCGCQAFLISISTVKYFLKHWSEIDAPPDLKMPALCARLQKPVYYHVPSLVQHVGTKSVWGGPFTDAVDFDGGWKAPIV